MIIAIDSFTFLQPKALSFIYKVGQKELIIIRLSPFPDRLNPRFAYSDWGRKIQTQPNTTTRAGLSCTGVEIVQRCVRVIFRPRQSGRAV